MPRDFAIVKSSFWTGETGRKLRAAGGDAQRVAMYLITCGSSNMIGLYYLPLPVMCHEIGITLQGASKALRCLSEAQFAYYDAPSEVIFVVEMAAVQVGEQLKPNDKRVMAIVKEWQKHRKCLFYNDFYERYKAAYHLPNPSPLEAPYKPLRSQEQEQDQEQDQDQDQDQSDTRRVQHESNGKESVDEVVAYYKTIHPRCRPGAVERTKVTARLKDGYSIEDLKHAIDGCHKSPWHGGENADHRLYQSLELIMRDSAHVQQFIEIATGDKQPVLSQKTQRSLRAVDSFMERRFGDEQGQCGGGQEICSPDCSVGDGQRTRV